MSFIQMSGSFSNVQERKPVPRGTYDLVIKNAEAYQSAESKKNSIKVTIGIEGHDEAAAVLHYVSLPGEGDDADKVSTKMLMIKRFLEAFSIPYEDDGFAIEDFFGARASCELTLTDPDDDANGNTYNRLNLPRLEDDATTSVASPASKAKKS